MLNVLGSLDKLINKIDIPKTQEETTQTNTLWPSDFKDILDSFAYKQRLDKDKVLEDVSKIFQDIFIFFQNIANTSSNNTFLNNKNQGTDKILIKLDNNTKNFAVNLLKDIEKLSKDINPNFDTNTIENIIKNIQNPKSNETFLVSISIREEIVTTSKNTSNFLESILSNLDKHILSQKDISSHISYLSFSLILEKENISKTLISLKAQKPNLNNPLPQIKPIKDYAKFTIQEDVPIPNNTAKNQSIENISNNLESYQIKSTEKHLKEINIPSDKFISESTKTNTDKQLENQQTKTERLDKEKLDNNQSIENISNNLESYQIKSAEKHLKEINIPLDKTIFESTKTNTDKQLENQQTKTEKLDKEKLDNTDNTKNITYKFENVEINIEINNARTDQPKDYIPKTSQDNKTKDIQTKDAKNTDTNQPNQTTKEYEQVEKYDESNKANNIKNQEQDNTNQTNNQFSTIKKSTEPHNPSIANEPTTIRSDTTSYKDTEDNKNTPINKDISINKDELSKNNQVDIVSIKDNNSNMLNKETTITNNSKYYKNIEDKNIEDKNIEEQKLFSKKDEIQSPKETNVTYYKENEQNIKDYIAKNVNALNLNKEPLPKTSLNNLHDFTNPIKDIIKESPDFQAFNTNDKQKDNKDHSQGFNMSYQQNIQTNQQNTTNSINTEKIFKEVEKTVLKETKNPVLMKNVSIQLDDGTSLQIKFNANNLSIAINTNTELVYKDSQIKDLLKNLQNLGFSVENITINGTTIESQMEFSQNKEQNKDDKEDYKKSNTEEKDFEFVNAI